jgi:hypothetical protein
MHPVRLGKKEEARALGTRSPDERASCAQAHCAVALSVRQQVDRP